MTKEKLNSLIKYVAKQKELLASPTTPSQASPEYKFYLAKDIKTTQAKIDQALMDAPAKK